MVCVQRNARELVPKVYDLVEGLLRRETLCAPDIARRHADNEPRKEKSGNRGKPKPELA